MNAKTWLGILVLLIAPCSKCDAAGVLQLAELNTVEIAALDRERTVVIIPGGILESHGPYLPSFSDGYVNIEESGRLASGLVKEGWTVVLFPPVPLGSGGANEVGGQFVSHGTYAVRPRTLRAIFMDIGMELAEQGFLNIFVIHKHGAPDHNEALDQASRFITEEYGARMVNLSGYAMGVTTSAVYDHDESLREEGLSIHAGAGETSQIMYLEPALVARSVKEAAPMIGSDFEALIEIAEKPGWPVYFGDPARATPDLGRLIIEHRSAAYLNLAVHILAGGNPDSLPGYKRYAGPENRHGGVDGRTQEVNRRKAKRQQAWIERNGSGL